jgi:hypothetical protein
MYEHWAIVFDVLNPGLYRSPKLIGAIVVNFTRLEVTSDSFFELFVNVHV